MIITMRSFLLKLITLVVPIFFLFSQPVLANAGPTFWQGYPSSEILVIDKNSPIEVRNEKLTFDFRDDTGSDYTLHGQVTASYHMVNPTDEARSVQMAFPFISRVYDLAANDIVISADEKSLSYEVYVGDGVKKGGNPSQQENEISVVFDDIVKNITNQSYEAKHFSEDEKGLLYTIEVYPTSEKGMSLAVDFDMESDKSKVLANGFNGYSRDGERARFTASYYRPQVLEIIVWGEQMDLNITEYSDVQSEQKNSVSTYQLTTKEVKLKSYMMDTAANNLKEINQPELTKVLTRYISEKQHYNLYAMALDKILTSNKGIAWFDELLAQNQNERILTMVYTVDFPAQSQKNIQVSYRARGTMDKTKTPDPFYTFNYLLNPAQNWHSFQKLNIEIYTPEKVPYIIDSNIELTQQDERYYTASLDGLPEGDFAFALYSKNKITLGDKIVGGLKNTFGYFMPLAILVVVVGIVVVLIGFIRRTRN